MKAWSRSSYQCAACMRRSTHHGSAAVKLIRCPHCDVQGRAARVVPGTSLSPFANKQPNEANRMKFVVINDLPTIREWIKAKQAQRIERQIETGRVNPPKVATAIIDPNKINQFITGGEAK